VASDPRSTPTIPSSHPAFVLSVIFGVLGVLTILIGAVVGGQTIFEVGVGIGALSLIAALAWRADLVSSWHREHPRS
jgi:Ca2+/Na+ antiporter